MQSFTCCSEFFLFFVKHKTAYELRISDWSSDVCSSDLICYGQQSMQAQLGGGVERGDSGEFGHAFIEILDSCVLFDGLWAEGESHQVWMSHGDKVTELAQIGRASWRERVCQYV